MKAVVPGHREIIQNLLRIDLPIMQAGSNGKADYRQSLSGSVLQGVSYPPQDCPKLL
jgi:hypothetical protein